MDEDGGPERYEYLLCLTHIERSLLLSPPHATCQIPPNDLRQKGRARTCYKEVQTEWGRSWIDRFIAAYPTIV